MENTEIQSILQILGERVPPASRLLLIGGSALALLGSPRQTIDIDFVGDDVHPSDLDKTIMQTAKELRIKVEPVPIERFIPLPAGSSERNIRIGQFGNLEELERVTFETLPRAHQFDINPTKMVAHLQTVRERLK